MAERCPVARSAQGGGPKGARNGSYKHGLFTSEAMQLRRSTAALLQASGKALADIDDGHGSRG
jgi:hypothetical protein